MLIVLATFGFILALVFLPYWAFVLRAETADSRKLGKRMKVSVAKSVARPDLIERSWRRRRGYRS